MRRFEGRVVLITGASRGIGLAVAERLVAEGARVCITARNSGPLEEAVAHLGGPEHAIAVAGKVQDTAHQAEAVAQTLERFGRLDTLVSNTAINPVYGDVLDIESAAASKIFEVNVVAVMRWCEHVRKLWGKEAPGTIVNVSSVAGIIPATGIGVYGVSKAALIQLTRQLALELAPNIRVNAVAPGTVRTKFATVLYEGREEEIANKYPLGRIGAPEDVSGAVAFLASDDAAWITGQTLIVDGGVLLGEGV